MPERTAIAVPLSDGFALLAAGVRRERNGDITADLQLRADCLVYSARTVINNEDRVREWAERATGPGRPSPERLVDATRQYLLDEALASLQVADDRPAQVDALIAIATSADSGEDTAGDGIELFHDPNGDAYADVRVGDHRETWAIASKTMRQFLAQRFYRETGRTASAQALSDAINLLAGRAQFDSVERAVAVRLAESDGTIYLDLGDDCWQIVAIDRWGWRVVTEAPVRFRRPKGLRPLPAPVAGGSLDTLRELCNLANDDDFVLAVGWLIGAFRPQGPYPILDLHGEQGSAKTTTARMLRALVDPNTAPVRSLPRDERDLMIAAINGRCLAFDNMSRLSDAMSDALCRIATGGGFAVRELYSDADEAILEAQRPMLLNGIDDVAIRSDLIDRSIAICLPPIPEARRRPEAEIRRAFEAARPTLLGCLLDAVSAALAREDAVVLDGYPRLADFARWVTAAEPALGWAPGTFLRAYRANRATANELALEASPVAGALLAWFDAQAGKWVGTAADLLRTLNTAAGPQAQSPSWPKSARGLSGALRRIAPNLRAKGVTVDFGRHGHGGQRMVRIERGGS